MAKSRFPIAAVQSKLFNKRRNSGSESVSGRGLRGRGAGQTTALAKATRVRPVKWRNDKKLRNAAASTWRELH
jgi:hypothetical protein